MPKLRETAEQKADRLCREAIAAGLARTEITKTQLAAELNTTRRTLHAHTNVPRKFPVGDLRKLYRMEVITAENIVDMICY